MRKRLLILAMVLMVLFLTGCKSGSIIPSITEDVEVWVTGFEQEVSCDSSKGITRVANGDLPRDLMTRCGYCYPPCPPPTCPPCNCPACDSCCPTCPACDSCCPDCPVCEDCPECICDECPECICDECPECVCPICPPSGPCCCYLTWGDVFVDFEMQNFKGEKVTVEKVCFMITFEDDSQVVKCVDLKEGLAGEKKAKQVKIKLSPTKRVVYVTAQSIEYY
ncbi:MAG: hypothetical protein PHG13_00200 [Candidatus Pacebacteria bacterium]|nr:hypothetical protein [Candidatus Paceibacterota bacterium]MDD5721654.1 hypothetical protein [Candidatus Paceibacterota bacterium]